PEPRIYVFYGHMPGDTDALRGADLVPLLASVDQLTRHLEALPHHPFGVQLDTGMNRLGLTASEWDAVADLALAAEPVLLTSHLASADDPESDQSARQLAAFHAMTDGTDVARSLAATGGTLLGPDYHFDMTRPGIGLYGGMPYAAAEPVVALDLPVIACFDVAEGDTVGYSAAWRAPSSTRIATVAGGYADGLPRALQPGLDLMAGPVPCPAVGRVSMDLLTVDISHLDNDPDRLTLLDPCHGVDALGAVAGTIGYEILTGLGRRYVRRYRTA
ncbi:MAG: alanine racemase C-terminal domain-containing protein, partial [Jannaschia sp.]